MAVLMAIVFLVAEGPLWSAAPTGGAAPIGKGWGRFLASGILLAIDPSAATATLAITGSGRLDAFEGGTLWQQKSLAGSHPITLLPATLVVDADSHPMPVGAVRAKDSATVWGAVRPDAAILAVTLAVTQAVAPGQASPIGAATLGAEHQAVEGVVLRRSNSTLDLLTDQGNRRSVVITAATAVRANGAAASAASLAPYDLVRVQGPVNSDGSLVATQIAVDFTASAAAQVSGPVERRVAAVGGLIVEATMIATSAETYFIRNGARGVFAQVMPARPVMVFGTPVLAGGQPVGLRARVVVMR